MIIKEIIKRECCEWDDLVPLLGTKKQLEQENGQYFLDTGIQEFHYMICIYCNSIHEYHRFTDAAGSTDWDYRKTGSFR